MKPRPGKSFQFASLSTRNGAPQFYWKELSGVSQKVALSALETHGSVEGLLAGESSATIGQVLDPSQLAAVRAVFKRLVGEETLARFAAAEKEAEDDGDSSPPPDDDDEEEEEEETKPFDLPVPKSASAKKEVKPRMPAAGASSSSDMSEVMSSKRAARMALVDELRVEVEASEKAEKAAKKAKREGTKMEPVEKAKPVD